MPFALIYPDFGVNYKGQGKIICHLRKTHAFALLLCSTENFTQNFSTVLNVSYVGLDALYFLQNLLTDTLIKYCK
jgi:hypothetical protein